jgi:EAL domain-containing protein (putative c-di-GMP-specific phosphodiesterase class I)
MEVLRALGCHEMQGYVYSPAVSGPTMVKLLLDASGREVSAA